MAFLSNHIPLDGFFDIDTLFHWCWVENSVLIFYPIGTLTEHIRMQIREHIHGLHAGELFVNVDMVRTSYIQVCCF